MPTGFGKTYSVIKYIINFISDKANAGKKIFFITTLKKNLPVNEMKKEMTKIGLQKLFEEKVIELKSNVETVLSTYSQSLIKDIPDEIKRSAEFKNFKNDVEFLQSNNNSLDFVNSVRDNFSKNNERIFRNYIQSLLSKKFATINDRIHTIKTDVKWQWIGKLYPSVFTREKQVIFLSMDKFICSHSTIVEKSYNFYNNDIIKNALVFIDEFDATKDTILKKIIDDGLKDKIDYIALFNHIYDVLQRKSFPKKLFTASEARKKGKYSKQDLRTIIDEFKEKADKIFKEYYLQFNHKMDNSDQEAKNFLFNDYRYITILNGQNSFISIKNDKSEEINRIVLSSEKPSDKNNIQILLGRLRGFVTWFQYAVRILAENYYHLKREHMKDGEEEFTYESAVYSVLSEFNLGEYENYIFSQIMMRKKTKNNIAGSEYDFTVYDNGFRFFTFDNSPNHEFNSVISMIAFSNTPEKILIKICERAKVIGVSATATIPSVLCNYDINYLSNKMGEVFVHISDEDYLRLKKEFHSTQIGYDNDIKIHTELFDSNDYSINLWKKILGDDELAEKAYNIIENSLSGISKSEYHKKRYYKIALAFKKFIENANIRSFLCLLNKHPKNNDKYLNANTLNELFSCIANCRIKDTKNIENMVQYLSGENYETKKDEIAKRLSNGEKIFVISVYQTMGAGQNIQYDIPAFLKNSLHKVNNRYISTKKDFDAIYLDKPTNLTINFYNPLLDEKDFIRYIFETEFLQENGEISDDTAKENIRKAFLKYYGLNLKNPEKYETKSVGYFATRQIIQAIGRICRTNVKNETVYIYADSEICNLFQTEIIEENYLLNPEVLALIKEIKRFGSKNSIAKPKLIDSAILRSSRVNKFIQNTLNEEWDNKSMNEWNDLRKLVLSYPTVNESEYRTDFKFSQFYIEMNEKTNKYFYQQYNDHKNVDISFIPSRNYPFTVSEQASKLDRIMLFSDIKQWFKSNNWATSFTINKYNMTPTLFNNIYKGALGEVAGWYLFEKVLKISLQTIDTPKTFELFDYRVKFLPIYVDFKNWHIGTFCDRAEMLDKVIRKARECEAKCVIIANIIAEIDDSPIIECYNGIKIVRCPSLLIDNGISVTVNIKAFTEIRSCINEIKNTDK